MVPHFLQQRSTQGAPLQADEHEVVVDVLEPDQPRTTVPVPAEWTPYSRDFEPREYPAFVAGGSGS